jgi:DNA-binding response OmpR family regulator
MAGILTASAMAKILVVDDEPDLVRFMRGVFETTGHQVLTATNGVDGIRIAVNEQPDLVVLDLMMPGLSGEAVLSALMSHDSSLRVLMLSAAGDVQLRVSCLENGAVDVLAKPFAVRELLARVRGRLREDGEKLSKDMLRVGALVLDLEARQLQVDGGQTQLSRREFLLLRYLMTHPDDACSRHELLSEVWGYDFDPATNVVDVCVRRLRAKVRPDRIVTVRSVGYQLHAG